MGIMETKMETTICPWIHWPCHMGLYSDSESEHGNYFRV